jgi:hypothetical protein
MAGPSHRAGAAPYRWKLDYRPRKRGTAGDLFFFSGGTCTYVLDKEEGMKIITGDDTGLIKVQTVSVLQAVLLQ